MGVFIRLKTLESNHNRTLAIILQRDIYRMELLHSCANFFSPLQLKLFTGNLFNLVIFIFQNEGTLC